jgi:FAD:protein FMN transferase
MVLTQPNLLERIRSSARGGVSDGVFDVTFQAMGTRCRVHFSAEPGPGRSFLGSVFEWVAAFEARYSRYLDGSLVSQINRAAGVDWVAIDPETERLLRLCDELHFLSRGVFDPTLLPLLRLWDWRRGVVPDDAAVAAARARTGWRKVQRAPGRIFLPEQGMALDLGGVGKEYAVDWVIQMGIRQGVRGLLVDFGQDIRVSGDPPDGRSAWHVGLEDPREPGRCWVGLRVRDQAVATSGDYVRCFRSGDRSYGHILDARVGEPVSNGCRAVSVVAPSCTLAGGLATAAMALGVEEGLRLIESTYQAEGAIVCEQGRHLTKRFHEYVIT